MTKITESGLSDRLMPGEAARMLGVSTKTLATMTGLNPIILPSGHRRYIRAEVIALSQHSDGARRSEAVAQ